MAEYPIHQRVFKVSKEMSQLDLLCEQHKRQIRHQNGLPDWETPRAPAGKVSKNHHVTTPAFFAWNQERQQSTWQTETPQKVARTLEMESEPDMTMERSFQTYSSEERPESIRVEGRCIAVSPMREDILDRVPPSATVENPTHLPVAEVSPSPYQPPRSSRYRQGRRLEENDGAIPLSRTQLYAAGVTTEQADRYRMSSATAYIHQSGASANMTTPSFSHKRQICSAAERTFGGSSVFRTLNMDTCNWPRSEGVRGQRRSVLTGSDATNVANQAVREFLKERNEESKQAELPLQQVLSCHHSVDNDTFSSVPARAEAFGAPTAAPKNFRKTKRVSFGENALANPPNKVIFYPQPRSLPVLADKTTQTEASLLPKTRLQTISDRLDVSNCREAQERDHASPARFPTGDTAMGDFERPRKIPRGSTNSVVAAFAEQLNYRRTSSHLTNPIMTNPRYQPEKKTTVSKGKSAYSTVFNDRLAWR
ncbi:unnamed protein product [Peronospora destructor]|uniref:Uncharacterized protein n=1 Tax=Peronospora destructor TaxID=86335 RepID=A0AAV0V475_9STRA|nr:unnamed protein product [Peronospora destructor]